MSVSRLVGLSAYESVHFSYVSLFDLLSVYMSVSNCSSVCPSVRRLVCFSVYKSVYTFFSLPIFIRPSIYMSLSNCFSVCPLVHTSVSFSNFRSLEICPPCLLFLFLFVHSFVYLSASDYLSVCLSVRSSIGLSVFPSIRPHFIVSVFVCPSVCLYNCFYLLVFLSLRPFVR